MPPGWMRGRYDPATGEAIATPIVRDYRRWTMGQVAEALRVSRADVMRWYREGRLTARNPRPGVYRVRHAAVRRLLREHAAEVVDARTRWLRRAGER